MEVRTALVVAEPFEGEAGGVDLIVVPAAGAGEVLLDPVPELGDMVGEKHLVCLEEAGDCCEATFLRPLRLHRDDRQVGGSAEFLDG